MDSGRIRLICTKELWYNLFGTISNAMTHLKPVPRLAELRQTSGLTQLEVSQSLGITENTYANWEKGRSGLEAIERIIKLCKLFNCPVEQLLSYKDVQP